MKIQGWMIIFVAVMTVLSSANAFYDEALQAGDKVELDILVNNVQNLAGIQFSLNYNQDVLELINKEEGSFFENTYSTNGTLGNGSINDIILLNLNSGANGSGLLYKFYFDAKTGGSAGLNFGDIMLANIDGNSLSTSLISTNVQITSLPIPDPDPIPEEDTTSPVVSIVSPSEGVVRNKVEIVVESFDESEISTLWVFLDGQMLGETSSSNITLIWDARKVKGDHEITAVAMDEFGNMGFDEITVTVATKGGSDGGSGGKGKGKNK